LKVTLLGTYPPPYGGISIHIQRLKAHLNKEGHECVVYGWTEALEEGVTKTSHKRWLLRHFFSNDGIVHHHDPDWKMRVMMGLMGLMGRKKTVISIHGESLNDSIKEGSWFRKQLIKFALKHIAFIIADNTKIKELVLSLGVKLNKVNVVSAFIPPIVKEQDYEKVPQYIWDFMKSRKPAISANAFQISFYNGIDLYGLDMIVELVDKLSEKYPQIGVVFCLPNVGDENYFSEINRRIKEKCLTENILFITKPLPEVYPIWEKSDIFVRPTVTDGDPLSVREALSLKTPVVTSDACPRPDGVILFKNRDLNDFVNAVQKVWENYDEYKKKLESMEVESGIHKILEIYNRLWTERV
jgi:glycosyltransferase involved in cell wall biosynthesis